MNGLIFGLYGLYAILVASNGNAGVLSAKMQDDSKGFLPWAISIGVLSVLYDNEATRPVAKPFIYLAILSFVLKNFTQLEAQFKRLYSLAGSTTNATTANNPTPNADGSITVVRDPALLAGLTADTYGPAYPYGVTSAQIGETK